ncbi:hypothetical protein F4782DRAFT_552427 [Xylaria castorea]|nr:hypothetical protein F4782DRAFT_552427 [Xylaria castorea]
MACHTDVADQDGVSKGQDHLAVYVYKIQDILQNPDKNFKPCSSTARSGIKRNRVQVLLLATFPKLWGLNLKSSPDPKLAPMGAVIFGRNTRFPLHLGDREDPGEGQPDQELEEPESSVHDSGIGTRLAFPGPGMSDGSSSRSFRSPS